MKEEISPNTDNTLMTKQEFLAKIERAMEDVKAGRTHKMKQDESLEEFLERMETDEI